MSASAGEAAVDYSKGPQASRRDFGRAAGPAAAVALAGAALLAIAELTVVFEVVVGSLETVKRSSTGGENHGYALLIVAFAAAVLALAALRGSRPAAAGVAALGAAALVVALAIDLPDTRGTGRLPESLAYEDARARAGTGLYLELAGGALLLVGGGLALRLSPASRPRAAPRS